MTDPVYFNTAIDTLARQAINETSVEPSESMFRLKHAAERNQNTLDNTPGAAGESKLNANAFGIRENPMPYYVTILS